MSELFPFGFPLPTALYLTLYIVTLAAHAVFMNYVVVGSALVAWRWRQRASCPSTSRIAEWLPFALSAAITAGVAPLLFIQILYQERFYTANLLLFEKWLVLLPLLAIGFYLLYVSRSAGSGEAEVVAARGARPARRVLGRAAMVVAWLCFVGIAFLWTQNNRLSIDRAAWPDIYARGGALDVTAPSMWRLLVWLVGAHPVFAAVHLWQLRAAPRRWLPVSVMVGWVLAGAAVLAYVRASSPDVRAAIVGSLAGPYAAVAIVAAVGNALAWFGILRLTSRSERAPVLGRGLMAAVSVTTALVVVAVTVVRESVRLAQIDIAALFPAHARAAEQGGLLLFMSFLVVNTGVVAWCVSVARRASARG